MAEHEVLSDDVSRTVELTPDESITDAIGRGHTLGTAIADIIDNSIDAKAENIRIRFITEGERLIGIRIRDDGIGMSPPVLQQAMTLGRRTPRDEATLGHFGIGLKAASLSQALTLTVYSRSYSTEPCAMRIRRGSFTGEILDQRVAENGYNWDARGPDSTGTVVEWHNLEAVNQSSLLRERRAWLEATTTSLVRELGLTFHRLLESRGVRITTETMDIATGLQGATRTVEPRDPFQFNHSGHVSYPARMRAKTADGAQLEADCFILPPRSDSPSAWLLGQNPVHWQGIYVYRNDRLLQAGGWLDIRQQDKRLRLARVRIDLNKDLERHLRLRHEKSGVTVTPEFTAALEAASNSSGISLDKFLDDAVSTYSASNARKQTVKPAVPIASGLADRVVEAIRSELGERDDDPIQIAWGMMPEGKLFEIQHDQRVIRFNLGYRSALGGENTEIVPTLVYLLLESKFTTSRIQQVTRDQVEAWQAIASASLLSQLGDDAFDPLANWPKTTSVVGLSASPNEMTWPRPTPPKAELRWAHLGHRGQIPPESEQTEARDEQAEYRADGALDNSAEWDGPEVLIGDDSFDTSHGHLSSRTEHDEEEAASAELTKDDDNSPKLREGFKKQDLRRVDVRIGDREVIAMYRARIDIDTIGATLGMEPREIAMRLCALALDLAGEDIDDHDLAAMHGLPYTPQDRERILEMYRDGRNVRSIAAHFNRTPFAVAWQLLSSPKRPIEIPRSLLKRVDRALQEVGASSEPDASDNPD